MDPMEMLVVPRLIALVITLPLLTFFSDVMGLFGGAMISQISSRRIAAAVRGSRASCGRRERPVRRTSIKAPIFGFSSPSSAACTDSG